MTLIWKMNLALALWLVSGEAVRVVVGHDNELPRCCTTKGTVEMQIVSAALRNGISPSRALARAWNESKYQQIDSKCCRSVFQLHKRYFPAMPVEQHIDVAVRFFASLVKRYGDRAELVYRGGLRAIKEGT